MENCNKEKMYVSLPMTGVADNNKQLENAAYGIASKMGYWAYLPSKLSLFVNSKIEDPLYRHYLGFDLWSLSRCVAMLICPGWENSEGCLDEARFALKHGIPIYDYMTMKIIDAEKLDRGLFPEKYSTIEEYEPRSRFGGIVLAALIITGTFLILSGANYWIHKIF